ncbi:exonuclease [Acanthamoeba polyphaga moumouvirus]|uniref:DNA mismatch repair ATPase MutS n=1 Tax=Acanthamoeba polyphaga moumouvirus TaxID=1269028 RepID=L7RCI5_9VIRU|nr:exonuclease [Acanthamoeba polyphaga moumouvirus]AGC02002.1 DNA mismatch repair ATPase MutS [Acanthamoeba polyphaga moumouvirus]AQN68370.1 DNA mismatch repair ATPase mutS [Saudi moumouvirus]
MSIYDIYFREQEKYSKIYGEKTVVFIQIGKFYEAYCTKNKGYVNLAELEPLLNIKFIRRDNKNTNSDESKKPNQFGINCVAISKNLATLTENGYTVVLFDQKTSNGENIERECIGVFSPGTYLSDRQMQDANYLLSVYISEEKQLSGKNLMAIGLTIVDVSTGTSIIHEFYSSKLDERFGLDELVRIMQTYRPTEIVVYYHPIEYEENTIKNIKLYLELDKFRNKYFYVYHKKNNQDNMKLLNEETFKINYQNDYLSTIFDLGVQKTLNKNKSAIETLNLQKRTYATISLMIMLKYIAEHNVLLLKNLSYPEIYLYNKHLILGNNAIEQLNVIDSNNLSSYNNKIESVFDVINKTSTPMGKRFLKDNLLNPMSQDNKEAISKRYEIIDRLIKNELYKKVKTELKNIYDMERLHRRMGMGIIVPYEFYRLDTFYQATNKIITLIKDDKTIKNIIGESTIKDFLEYQINYNKVFELEKLQNYNNFTEIDHSFFKVGIYPNIDKVQEQITYVRSLIKSISEYFTNLIESKCIKSKNKDILVMESNEREGYFFTINKSNEKILKEAINKCKNIKIELSVGNSLKLTKEDIVFKQLPKGRTKIFVTPMVEHTVNLSKYTTKLTKLTKKLFIESMVNYYTQYKIMMHKICRFIAEIDFLTSGAMVATDYYYCKPIIPSKEKRASYIKVKGIRHAIVERLCNETEYVPNDIELGNVPDENIESKNTNTGVVNTHNGKMNKKARCLHPDTDVMMFDGRIKKAKEIVKDDMLMGDDSEPRYVLETCKGEDEMYKIVPMKGEPYIVNGSHILCLKSSGYKSVCWAGDKKNMYQAMWMENHVNRSKSFNVKKYGTKEKAEQAAREFLETVKSDKGKILHISVDDYLKKPSHWRINYYTYHVGVDFIEQEVDVDPYIIGHWLGDGTSASTSFTSADQEIVDYYEKYFNNTGISVKKCKEYRYDISTGSKKGGKYKNWYLNALNKYNLINNKHIPEEYLLNSRQVRLAVLAGLIDSDGSNCKNRGIDIIQKNERLADDIVYLARSLGFWCDKKQCTKTCTNGKNGPVTGTYYRIYIYGNDFSELPLLLEYKRPHPEEKTHKLDHLISSFKIEKLGKGKYCGFELDGNHRFLLGDFTVTHNSSISENLDIGIPESKPGKNGVVLFSLNWCGKSTLMKAIGISIILAQIGYYVPAEEFIYEPYMALYARITGNDNIFKGLSSFALEMTELDAILMRTESQGENTLVIGDEVCRGTEDISGRAIVASALVSLSECNSTFIFSSHLHDIQELEEIKSLKNLRFFHLRAEYDEENDCIVFDRRLMPGSGPSVYGLMVAKYLVKNAKFISRAEKIKKRLMGEDKIDIPVKTSNYNKDLLVRQCCICNYCPTMEYHKELESHHIHFQKNCWEDGKIKEKPYLHKNRLYNLVVLCRKCHNKVHQGEIIINGYVDTIIGPLLDYKVNVNKKLYNGLKKLDKIKTKKVVTKKISKQIECEC